MSAKRYTISGSTADGEVLSPDMSHTHERGYVAFTFYSDVELETIVTPTAGTVTTTVSENGEIFGTVSNNVTNAVDVGPAVLYVRPNWSGSARSLKLLFASIADGAFFKCVISRFGS